MLYNHVCSNEEGKEDETPWRHKRKNPINEALERNKRSPSPTRVEYIYIAIVIVSIYINVYSASKIFVSSRTIDYRLNCEYHQYSDTYIYTLGHKVRWRLRIIEQNNLKKDTNKIYLNKNCFYQIKKKINIGFLQ